MQGQPSFKSQPERAWWGFVGFWGCLVAVTGISIVCVSLWISWTRNSSAVEGVIETLPDICWVWVIVSLLQTYRGLRKLDSPVRLTVLSGSRPDDPDELFAWKWGWQFVYAVLAFLVTPAAVPFVHSLVRK